MSSLARAVLKNLHPPCSLESPSAADLMSLQVSASHAGPPERPTTRSLLTWPVPFVTMGPPATPFAATRKGCLAAAVSCARGGPMMPHTVRGVLSYARHLRRYPTGDARRHPPSSWRSVGLRPADRLVRGRGDDLHVYAAPHDERVALGPHRLHSQPDRARPAAVDFPDDHHRRQLRVHSSAE